MPNPIPTDAELSQAYNQGYADALRWVGDNADQQEVDTMNITAKPAARTPGPWEQWSENRCAITTRTRAIALTYHPEYNQDEPDIDAANAAFIVTACNAYDADRALIAELSKALRDIAGGHVPGSFDLDPVTFHSRIFTWCQETARAALAKAEQHNKGE